MPLHVTAGTWIFIVARIALPRRYRTTARWQKSVVEGAFRVWRRVAATRLRQRAMLERTFKRWERNKIKVLLREWRLQTEDAKKRKALTQVADQEQELARIAEVQKGLDAESAAAEGP